MRLQTGQIVGKKLGDKESEAVECRSALRKKKKISERQREEREGETYEKRKQFFFVLFFSQIVDM